MLTAIIGVVGGLIAASGWFFAWRSRGESRDALALANEAAERARLAEARSDADKANTFDAEARAATAQMLTKEATETSASLRMSLDRAVADKRDLLEKLAKLGVPVGPDLFDSTTNRLYANRDRGSSGGSESSGAGPNPADVPTDPADPAAKPRTN